MALKGTAMDTTHHAPAHHPRTSPEPGREAAFRWLASQLRWERTLAVLREAGHDEDRPEAA